MNVGYATLQVIPSLRGVDKQIQSQLGPQVGAAGQKAGQAAGQGFASKFGSAVSGIASSVASTVTNTLAAAGTAGGALLGASLVKGFDRFTAIENATQSLTVTLGSAAGAGELLKGVLDTVRGTPFSLDQFATGAQRLAGMGVEAAKIPHFLDAIGNAASTQGRNADEFVSRLIRVFGQIQAQGRVMGQDILQISETGVNALAVLGNHFGLTTEQMRDMISRGAVPAQEALDVLADGILNGSDGVAGATVALGGQMEALGTTLTGTIANFGAALGRLGANIIEPLAPIVKTGLSAAIELFDALGEHVAGFGDSLEGRFPIFDRFFQFLSDSADDIGPIVDKLKELAPALAPLIGIAGGLGLSSIGSALGPLGFLIPSIGPLGGLLAGLVAVSPELRDAFKDIAAAAMPLVEDVFTALQPLLEQLAPVVTALAEALGALLLGALEAIVPIIPAFVEFVGVLADEVIELLPTLVEVGLALLSGFLPAVEALLPVLTTLVPVIAALATALAAVITAAPPGVITGMVAGFLALRGVQAAVSGFKSLHTEVVKVVTKVGEARTKVAQFFSSGGSRLAGAFRAVGSAASSAVTGIKNGATALAGWVRSAAIATATAARTTAAWIAQKVAMVASTIATYAMSAAQAALNLVMALNPIFLVVAAIVALIAIVVLAYQHVGWFRDLVDAALQAVLGAFQAVFNWVKDNWPLILAILTGPIGLAVLFITSHWDTIKAGFTAVKDWIAARIGDIVGFFSGLPGRLASAASGLWNFISDGFKAALNAVIRMWNGLRIPGFSFHLSTPGPIPDIDFSWGGLDLPNIPTLHTGGIFTPGGNGREGLALLERGEGVFTRSQMAALGLMADARASGGGTVVIDGSGLDKRLLEWLRYAVRAEGGDVQIVLGR